MKHLVDAYGDLQPTDLWEEECTPDETGRCTVCLVHPDDPGGPTLRDLILAFIAEDDDAKLWGMEPDDFADAPDCDVMSDRFAAFLARHGVTASRLDLTTSSPLDSMVGPYHAVVDVGGICVDWTARQFYNANYVMGVLDSSDIPCPLLFVRGGQYPIPSITIEEEGA